MTANIILSRATLAAVLSLIWTACSLPAVAANLVKNGSFEDTGGKKSSYFIYPEPPNAQFGILPEWDLDKTSYTCLDYNSANPICAGSPGASAWVHPGKSPDGGNSVVVDSDKAFSKPLTQEITGLTVGSVYKLTFYQASGQFTTRTGATTELWEVTFGTEKYQSTLMTTPSMGSIGWMQQTMTFTATASEQVLSFFAVGTPDGLPPLNFLDGVVLEQDGPAVPEPATFAMIGFGLLSLPLVNRIRSRRKK